MDFGILLLLLVFLVLPFLFCVSELKKVTTKEREWAAAALRLGGFYDSATEVLRFSVMDHSAVLVEKSDGEGGTTFLDVDLVGLSPRDLELRDLRSDPRFVLTFEPEASGRRFTFERKPWARRAFDVASVASVDLSSKRLRLTLDGGTSTRRDILSLVEMARVIAQSVLGPDPTYEPLDVNARRGRCLVCRSPLQDSVVACRRCRTPHHEECWQLARTCAVYGCREERFISN